MWLRRSIANLAYVIPWPALRAFKKAVDTMHPVCAKVFYEKKAAFDEGGIAALANTASGGRDLTTLLSESTGLEVQLSPTDSSFFQCRLIQRQMKKTGCLTK